MKSGPAATAADARAWWRQREPRTLNHNPLGAWMIVALLTAALRAGTSGWLYDTDRFWGDADVYAVHQVADWAFAVLAPLHVAGVLLATRRQRESLIVAMVSGRKRAAAGDDVG